MQKSSTVKRVYQFLNNPDALFWTLQLAGWLGLSLITYLALSLPYDQVKPLYLAHNFLQSILGVFLSLPLRYVSRSVWGYPALLRLTIVLCTALLMSAVWSALRLLLFILMTGEQDLLRDFGGWLFPSIFVFVTWTALYHGIKYYQLLQAEHQSFIEIESLQRKDALRMIQVESAAHEAQLKLLRYQLNPHFLFNTLNSITALVASNEASGAQDMLLRLSHFLRFSLDSDPIQQVSLESEIDALRLYLGIEQVRFSDRLKVKFAIDAEASSCLVPSLLTQPLVENAIQYSIAQSEQGGVIRVGARICEDQLLITVDDSGIDYIDTDMTVNIFDKAGIGLSNTRDRLEALYGDNHQLSAQPSALGGICVAVSLPVNR